MAENKGALVVLLGFLTAGWLLLRRKPAPVGGEVGALVGVAIFDADGNEVPHNSPAELVAGASYTVRATITNRLLRNSLPPSGAPRW